MRTSLKNRFDQALAAEFAAQPLSEPALVTDSDLAHLPEAVRRYVELSGAVGRPRTVNLRAEFDALMWRAADKRPMRATSVQYNFFGSPARLFFMRASMFGLPVHACHIYSGEEATFTVRAASLVTMVDHAGPELSDAETVTLLNDMVVLAPESLIDPRLSWAWRDDLTSTVCLTNGSRKVSATVSFSANGELVDFVSDDRPASQDDGSLRAARWSTPLSDYRELDGRHVATVGDAIYHYPEGDLTYGRFTVRSVARNLAAPVPSR